MDYLGLQIIKYLQSGFRIQDEKVVIYVDPFRLPADEPMAGIVVITHSHPDHFDKDSLERIVGEDTLILSVQEVLEQIEIKCLDKVELIIDDEIDINGIRFSAVPAYNIDKYKTSGEMYHPKQKDWVGVVIELAGVTIFHMGDTDNIPELAEVSSEWGELDIVMAPVSGTYVMTAVEAVEAVKTLQPKVAIPMHHDAGVVGSMADAEYLKANSSIQVEILEPKK